MVKLPSKRTVNINIKSAESVNYLPNCDLKTLRKLENETSAVASLRKGARQLRMEREGEPFDKPLSFYASMSASSLQYEIGRDMKSGKIRRNTHFYRSLEHLIN